MSEETSHRRSIRSFVKRESRMTDGQKTALDKHWPEFGIEADEQLIDLQQCFKRYAPTTLDIGTGMGETTADMAKRHPSQNFLAVEVHLPGIGSLIRQAVADNLTNIRAISEDVNHVLEKQLKPNSIHAVSILFPDPWPKKRHHKRRLIQTEFLDKIIRVLRKDGRLFLATDWQHYAEHMLEVCDAHPQLQNLAGLGNYAPRPYWRRVTKFENRGNKLGHGNWDLVYTIR